MEETLQKPPKEKVAGFQRSTELILVLLFIAVVILFSVLDPRFLSKSNIRSLVVNISLTGTMILGMTFVILTGGIDLSIGGIMAVSAMYSALALEMGFNWLVGLCLGLCLGVGCGLVNGLLIANAGITPFIATLGITTISRGIAILAKGGYSIMISNTSFCGISDNLVVGSLKLPIPFIIFVLASLISYVVLEYTPFGVAVYAVGSNREGARLSGIKVNKVILTCYFTSGLFAGFSGVLSSAYVASAAPNMGNGIELDIISAVVLGGVSLTGGQGKIYSAIIGYLIISILINGLTLLGIGSDIQYLIRGLVLLVAVFVSSKFASNIE